MGSTNIHAGILATTSDPCQLVRFSRRCQPPCQLFGTQGARVGQVERRDLRELGPRPPPARTWVGEWQAPAPVPRRLWGGIWDLAYPLARTGLGLIRHARSQVTGYPSEPLPREEWWLVQKSCRMGRLLKDNKASPFLHSLPIPERACRCK